MSKQKYLKIDFEILQCLELSWQEKVVYAEIVHLDKIGGCTASQKHFCDLLNIKKDVCSRVFKKLQEKGFVLKNKKQYFPLKFVDQKSTNELIKNQPKVDQKSTGVDQKSTEHHIYKEKKENRERETPAPTPEKQLPKHMIATDCLLVYLKENEDMRNTLRQLSGFKGTDKQMAQEAKDFCSYYYDSGILMNQIIKNPMQATGKFQVWLRRSRDFNKNNKPNHKLLN